jgi:hypothetical protein
LNPKVLAAIAAAVNSYLAEEQVMVTGELPAPAPSVALRVTVNNLWGQTGRDEQMKMCALWQLKAWK